jgi:hypothetical protein
MCSRLARSSFVTTGLERLRLLRDKSESAREAHRPDRFHVLRYLLANGRKVLRRFVVDMGRISFWTRPLT